MISAASSIGTIYIYAFDFKITCMLAKMAYDFQYFLPWYSNERRFPMSCMAADFNHWFFIEIVLVK